MRGRCTSLGLEDTIRSTAYSDAVPRASRLQPSADLAPTPTKHYLTLLSSLWKAQLASKKGLRPFVQMHPTASFRSWSCLAESLPKRSSRYAASHCMCCPSSSSPVLENGVHKTTEAPINSRSLLHSLYQLPQSSLLSSSLAQRS